MLVDALCLAIQIFLQGVCRCKMTVGFLIYLYVIPVYVCEIDVLGAPIYCLLMKKGVGVTLRDLAIVCGCGTSLVMIT